MPRPDAGAPWFLPMPPPNITGALHLGHALFLTLQDIATRHRLQRGDDALWLPGTDHAGLATHEKIEQSLREQGLDASDHDAYMAEGWAWKERFHARITGQIRRMGAACDWSCERFTLDASYQASTIEAFRRICTPERLSRREGQWYLDMKDHAAELLAALDAGDITITPASAIPQLRHFLHHIEPWCLSRQIPWGLQMPLHHHASGQWRFAAPDSPLEEGWQQETSTLDTWFLSSLWPFATLGWPENTPDFQRYYPAAWMETGDDILFFWCARMLMMGKDLTGEWPFRHIHLHGLIRDSQNRKMSKSLGNGIDPLELIDRYGTDALRWTLCTMSEPGLDIKFNPAHLSTESKFLNKIWQAGRFIGSASSRDQTLIAPGSQWGQEMAALTQAWDEGLLQGRFSQTARLIQGHFRDRFCSEWIEQNKAAWHAQDSAIQAQGRTLFQWYLTLFHPFLPFLTSELSAVLGLLPCQDFEE